MNLQASKDAVISTRKLLQQEPSAFCLPLGAVETADANHLLTLAATLVVWVQQRENCTAEAAMGLLRYDYVFDAILSAAADRTEAKS